MDDYLCKPLDLTRLGTLLRRWIPSPGAAPPPLAPQSSAPTLAAEAEPTNDAPAIDAAVIGTLCGDDPELIREMLTDFVAVSQRVCGELVAALKSQERTALKDCAHNLKGSSRTAGARVLGEAARRVEAASGNEGWEELQRLTHRIEEEMDRVARHVAEL